MRLTEDAISLYKKDIIYGRQGEEVKLISDHGTVCIVEGADGVRFSILKSMLSETVEEIKTQAAPGTAAPTNPITKRAAVSKKKELPLNQQQLF